MKNCLRTYSSAIAGDYSRIWSIRREGRRIATLQIYRVDNDPYLHIGELKAVSNKSPSTEVYRAAHLWLRSQESEFKTLIVQKAEQARVERAAWIALWRPYWLAKRHLPAWLPITPSRNTLWAL